MSIKNWPIALDKDKRFRIFMSGPPGCFKTRVMLGLANGDINEPSLAVVDTEFGTDHYGNQFAFRRLKENDPAIIKAELKDLVKTPGPIKTLGIDSFSVYYEALIDEWVDRFLKREITSAGNKGEYYTLQPRDYVHINRSASKVVRLLLESNLNLICTCQVKDKWQDMKVIGSVFDGWKRLPYYFDTIIEISEDSQGGWKAFLKGKDRSGFLVPGQEIPWENDVKIVKYLIDKFGQDLTHGPGPKTAEPVIETKTKAEPPAEKKKKGRPPKAKPAKAETETESAAKTETETESADKTESPFKDDVDTSKQDRSGVVTRDRLMEIVKLKANASINDPKAWAVLVSKYNHVDTEGNVTDTALETAKDMTMDQAFEFMRDLVEIAANPT